MAAPVDKAKRLLIQELKGPAICRVFVPPKDTDGDGRVGTKIVPEIYYLAAGELLATVIVVSWIITLIARPISPICKMANPNCTDSIFKDNALKRRIGYNNLCVGFDAPPATYVAAFLWIFVAYLAIKFAWLDIQRTELVRRRLSNCKTCFSIATDVLYMLAMASFSLVYIIKPYDSVWGHSGGFILLAFVQWLVLLANTLEGTDVPWFSWAFVVIYGIITLIDFGLIGSNYIYYARTGKGPWNPWWIGWLFDYGWFACLPLTTVFLPNSEALQQQTRVVEATPLGAVDEEDTLGLCGGGNDVDDDDELSS